MKSRFIDKVMDRLDRIDTDSLQGHFLRLAREKGLMETILQVIQEGIVVLDDSGRFTYANEAAGRLLGLSPDRLPGETIAHFIPDIDWSGLCDMNTDSWARMVSSEIETLGAERRVIEFYVVPLAVAEPRERGTVLILRDVTRDREQTDKVIESERIQAITLLAASVAHEIGNPLNALTIHLQLLERELRELCQPPPEHLLELVHISREEIARLDQIITHFLRALRPASLNLAPTQLDETLRQALDFMRVEIENRSINVNLTVEKDLPRAMADADQMRQVFFNLMKNALEAMSSGGQLDLRMTADDRFVAVMFRDHGPGFSREQMGRLFEPFQSTKREGSGLGLMVVQRIVRDHGGEINVHNEPGQGASIALSIPRSDRRVRLLRAHEPASRGGNTS